MAVDKHGSAQGAFATLCVDFDDRVALINPSGKMLMRPDGEWLAALRGDDCREPDFVQHAHTVKESYGIAPLNRDYATLIRLCNGCGQAAGHDERDEHGTARTVPERV